MIPATMPIVRLIPGLATTPDGAPMATPPAKVAFRMCSILNLSWMRALIMKVDKQLPVREIIVLLTTRDFWKPLAGKQPALKDGQNIHRNRVPIMAKVEFTFVVSAFLITLTFLQRIKQTVSPKQAPQVWMGMLPPASKQPSRLYTISQLSVQPTIPPRLIKSNSKGPTFPSTAPKAISMEATEYEAAVNDFSLISMQMELQWLWNTRCQNPCRRGYSCRMRALMKKVQDRALQVQFLTKVIRNPNPINIITFTSWNMGQQF